MVTPNVNVPIMNPINRNYSNNYVNDRVVSLTVEHSLIKYYKTAFRTIGDEKSTLLSYISVGVDIR